MPYACRIKTPLVVTVFKKKFRVNLASSPASANDEARDIFNDVFKGYVEFEKMDHVLMTDMSNINFTLHPFPVLLNYGEIEKHPATFRHYMDGITPLISEQMHKLDEERLAIGKGVGFKLTPVLEHLKNYYGQNDSRTIYEYVNSPETPYADLVGHNVRGRYLTEDVPGVIAPLAMIAREAGIKSPVANLVVDLASQLHDTDYWSKTTLESLGMGGKTIAGIIEMME